MPHRFVIHHHVLRDDAHYDLMFEDGPGLATWRSPRPLAEVGPVPLLIERIGMHRLAYLDYQGPVAGDRGVVTIVERGVFDWHSRAERDWIITVESDAGRRAYHLQHPGPSDPDWTIARVEIE